jgi:hypothetical protein
VQHGLLKRNGTPLQSFFYYENTEASMSSFNWSAIDWVSLFALSLFVLIVARIGEQLSFGNRGVGALITALLFALGFAVWSYSLHDTVAHAFSMLPGRAS